MSNSTTDTDEGEVLLRLERRGDTQETSEELRVSVREYKAHRFADVRLFWRNNDGEMRPGKKGIALRKHELAQVASALDAALGILEGKPARQPEDFADVPFS